MAQIVSIIGITHNPFMPRLFKQPTRPPGCAKIIERIDMMREKLAEFREQMLRPAPVVRPKLSEEDRAQLRALGYDASPRTQEPAPLR